MRYMHALRQRKYLLNGVRDMKYWIWSSVLEFPGALKTFGASQWIFFDGILNPSITLFKSLSVLIQCRMNGVPIGKGPVTTCRLPLNLEAN